MSAPSCEGGVRSESHWTWSRMDCLSQPGASGRNLFLVSYSFERYHILGPRPGVLLSSPCGLPFCGHISCHLSQVHLYDSETPPITRPLIYSHPQSCSAVHVREFITGRGVRCGHLGGISMDLPMGGGGATLVREASGFHLDWQG